MELKLLAEADAGKAGALAYDHHLALRALHPWLPEKKADEYVSRILWMIRNGSVHSAWSGDDLLAIMGWFPLEEYRNEGLAAFTPDWCVACAASENTGLILRILLRSITGEIFGKGIRIHGAAVPANREDFRLAFDLSCYGRIVMDAGRSTEELVTALEGTGRGDAGILIRRAETGDAASLAAMDAELARHIAAPPVLMPRTHGSSAAEWGTWLGKKDAIAFTALREGKPVGFIKAQDPQIDVTFTVHGPSTLAINGMFVLPEERGRSAGPALLQALSRFAAGAGKTMVSVDCETMNPEAYGFWTRYFTPLSWSMERRFTLSSS